MDIAVLRDKDCREPGEVCIIEVMYQGRVQMMVEIKIVGVMQTPLVEDDKKQKNTTTARSWKFAHPRRVRP